MIPDRDSIAGHEAEKDQPRVATMVVAVAVHFRVGKRPFRGMQEGLMSEAGTVSYGFGQEQTKAARRSGSGQKLLAVVRASTLATETAFQGLEHSAVPENIWRLH